MIKIPEIGIQLDAAITAKYSYAKLAAKSFWPGNIRISVDSPFKLFGAFFIGFTNHQYLKGTAWIVYMIYKKLKRIS
jgi:hypothetical protein